MMDIDDVQRQAVNLEKAIEFVDLALGQMSLEEMGDTVHGSLTDAREELQSKLDALTHRLYMFEAASDELWYDSQLADLRRGNGM